MQAGNRDGLRVKKLRSCLDKPRAVEVAKKAEEKANSCAY
jgi:hypothetical protein